jgi:hypothetical protein
MKKFKLALAGLAAVGAALVAAPEPAKAGGLSISFGFGHPGYYGYGYRPVSYGYYPRYGYYHRPVRRVVVYRSYRPAYHYRPRRVVYGYPHYYRPHRVRYVSYGHRHHRWKHHRRHWW